MRPTLVCFVFLAPLFPVRAQDPMPPTTDRFLAESLDEVLAGKRPMDEVGLKVEWTEDGKESSVTIYGDGLGIHWQGKQFRLSAEQQIDLLGKLKAAKFLEISQQLGGAASRAEPLKGRASGRGRISLRIGALSKTVDHDASGRGCEEFAQLAKGLIAACVRQSASGVGIDNLADGLQKVLDKKIDIRAVRIEVSFLQHLACHTLEVEGLSAKVRGQSFVGERFHGQKTLTAEELTALVKKVQAVKFQELPGKITPHYDILLMIKLRVLNKEHNIGGFGYDSERSSAEQWHQMEAIWNACEALQPTHVFEKK